MNFQIAKTELLNALTLCSRAVSSTTPLPILSGIYFSLSDYGLTLISSDSNISIKTVIEKNDEKNTLNIHETGEVVLEARYILEIIRKIESEYITIETIDGNLIKVSGGKSEYKINGMNAYDYPAINFDTSDKQQFEFDTLLFNQIIDETAFACSESESRPVLTGVNLKAHDHKLFANATDSYRLASKTIDIDKDLQFDITIPKKYLSEIYHAISGEKVVNIAIDKQKISFLFGNTVLETRLLEDEFPSTEKLIPTDVTQKLVVSSKALADAIDKTLFIKADGKNIVKLSINNQNIEISSSNQTTLSFFDEVEVISFEGEPFEISCSGKYLQDAIKAIGYDEIVIDFAGELKPMVIKKEGDDSLIQLISPVRTYH